MLRDHLVLRSSQDKQFDQGEFVMKQRPKPHLLTQNPGFPPLTVSVTLFTLKTIFSTNLRQLSKPGRRLSTDSSRRNELSQGSCPAPILIWTALALHTYGHTYAPKHTCSPYPQAPAQGHLLQARLWATINYLPHRAVVSPHVT